MQSNYHRCKDVIVCKIRQFLHIICQACCFQIKAVYLHDEPLTPECGLLTPTLKSKRSEMAKYFSKQIAAMYAELEETGSTAPAEKTNSKL